MTKYSMYRVYGQNRMGECITATFESRNRPNTKAWFAEVAEHEMWRGVTFTKYVNLSSFHGECRAIKEH